METEDKTTMPAKKIEDFRSKAEECLRRATETSRPEDKAILLEMAQQWLMLATSAEKRQGDAAKKADD